jgi:hypothetical protein
MLALLMLTGEIQERSTTPKDALKPDNKDGGLSPDAMASAAAGFI